MASVTITIHKKMSGTGSIHDLASDMYDRDIVFAPGCKYAVILAAYYGGKGYTTHKTEAAAIKASNRLKDYSREVIDITGTEYYVGYDRLLKK